MSVLAIETATANRAHPASIALGGTLHVLEQPNSQAAQLVSCIEQLLSAQSLWYSDLTQLLITTGPGSFTGIRIGLSVARGIAFACPKLQLRPISTLEAMAAAYEGTASDIQVILRAGKGELYRQFFTRQTGQIWHASSEIDLLEPEAIDTSLPTIGNGINGHSAELDAALLMQTPARIALQTREAVPLYIRAPDAKLPAKAGAL